MEAELAEVEAETLGDTLAERWRPTRWLTRWLAEVDGDTLVDTLAEVEAETLGLTLAEVEARHAG